MESKAWRVFLIYENECCLVILGGLSRMISTPSGRLALRTSGDIDLVSKGKVEAQFCVASDGRSC